MQDLSNRRLSKLNEADYALSDELVSRVMTPLQKSQCGIS